MDLLLVNIGMNSYYNTLLCVLFDVDPLLIEDVIDF